jgi:S-formylglutathione hydrolase FrmB
MTEAFRTCEISNPNFMPDNLSLVTVKSKNLNGRGDMLIINQQVQTASAPVVILLHGVYGSHWAWQYSVGAQQSLVTLLKQHNDLSDFVVVMPSDGLFGDGSAYLPISGHGNFEKWIVEDVIAACQQVVPNIDDNSSVYISGLSMGGYGALRLGFKYPEIFSGITAHSAITQLDEMALFVEEDINIFQKGNEKNAEIIYWLEKNRQNLPPLRFDCGVDDPLITGNRNFERYLKQHGFDYEYQEFSGAHDFEYWAEHIQQSFLFFDQIEKKKSSKLIDEK